MISVTTPQSITSAISSLCSELVASPSPQYLSLQAESYAIPGDCYGAVSVKVRRDGGAAQYGWIIWQTAELMIEAEFHAVWKSSDGTLTDITPKVDGETVVLFLPDPVRVDEGGRIDNVRRVLKQDRVSKDYISACERLFKIEETKMHFGSLFVEYQQAHQLKIALQGMLSAGKNQSDLCFCGEGIAYFDCHAETAQTILSEPF